MIAAELFCGMGLSACGLVRAGADVRMAVDIQPSFVRAFNAQKPRILPAVGVVARVGGVELPNGLRLISAGPVCKAFSPGATLFGTKGQEDERNTFPPLIADVERHRPEHLMVENTFGIQRFAGYVGELRAKLESLGYHVEFFELDCFDFGIPQHRRRALFLCSTTTKGWGLERPAARLPGPETVGDCLNDPPSGDSWPLLAPLSDRALDYFLRDPRHAKKHPPLTPDKPASTVVSVYRKGVPYGLVLKEGRYYHCGPRLAARLQGLPDEYDLSAMSKTTALEAIGNGFPPQVVEFFASQIIRSRAA